MRLYVGCSLLLFVVASAGAGEFRATPVESRILDFLDRDSDGRLSVAEIDRFPTPMQSWVDENGLGVDVEDSVSLVAFGPTLREMLGDLREGRHSRAARTSPAVAGSMRPTITRSVTGSGSRASEQTSAYVFSLMDRNRDGRIDRGEWDRSQTVRPWFEDEGIEFTGEMSREDFVSHMSKLAKRVEQND